MRGARGHQAALDGAPARRGSRSVWCGVAASAADTAASSTPRATASRRTVSIDGFQRKPRLRSPRYDSAISVSRAMTDWRLPDLAKRSARVWIGA